MKEGKYDLRNGSRLYLLNKRQRLSRMLLSWFWLVGRGCVISWNTRVSPNTLLTDKSHRVSNRGIMEEGDDLESG